MARNPHLEAVKAATADFTALIPERRNIDRLYQIFQTAFNNPYHADMLNLNVRWHTALCLLRQRVRQARSAGVARHHLRRVLDPLDTWYAVQQILNDLDYDIV